MTDLQVKYQTLLETQRANREQERLKEIETTSKAELNKASVDKIYEGEIPKLQAELPKVLAEIREIDSRTDLNAIQKDILKSKRMSAWMENVKAFTRAVSWPIPQMTEAASSGLASGAGKAVGSLILA